MATSNSQSGLSSLCTSPHIGGGISSLHPSVPPVGGEGGGVGINKRCPLSNSSHPAINNAVHSSATVSTCIMQISANSTSSSSVGSIHPPNISQQPPPPISTSILTSQHSHHLNTQNASNVNLSSASISAASLPSIQPSNISSGIVGLPSTSTPLQQIEKEKIYQLVTDIGQSNKREVALLELSKRRETFSDLGPLLWYSFGTITALLQELISIYPLLSPPSLTASSSNRVCNSLALLQCVASHSETRHHFLNAHIPLFLYPFLNTVSKSRPFEYLRLTSLGVIGALVKVDNSDVINFLLQTEIIPLCLRIMEIGSELSKTVATFIVQKILLDDSGLNYVCTTAERFFAVSSVLSNMINSIADAKSTRLLKHVVRCYHRLACNCRAREALKQCLPEALKDKTFQNFLKDDFETRHWLLQLHSVLNDNSSLHVSQVPNQNLSLQQKQQQGNNN